MGDGESYEYTEQKKLARNLLDVNAEVKKIVMAIE